MAFQIVSDLHLESPFAYDVFEITPQAPYLVLLGDIGNVVFHDGKNHEDGLKMFLTTQLEHFDAVVYIPGNHEPYGSTWADALDILREFETSVRSHRLIGDFILLDRGSWRVPETNIVVLGCSLFSYVPRPAEEIVSFGVNDFFQIQDWDVAKHNEVHKRDLEWLNEQVRGRKDEDVKIVIFTHWSPTIDPRASDPRHTNSAIKSAFATDLSSELCFKDKNVRMWAFGHTHYNCDFVVEKADDKAGTIRLMANQRGHYFSQAEGFDAEKVVDISDL